MLLVGCTGSPGPRQSWVSSHGGLDAGGRQERVDRAVRGLLDGVAAHAITVYVLDTAAVGAYGWPDGEVFLTRGLVDRLDDAEIAAAVAHELGHLLRHGHARNVVSLSGVDAAACEESAADALGVGLLIAHRVPADAMARMLATVAVSPGLSPACRRSLRQRIDALLRQTPAPSG
jgi:hypothetical protein